jgi:Flp pilus assembly protein TadG
MRIIGRKQSDFSGARPGCLALASAARRRRGATVVEVAFVAPLTFLLVIGLITSGLAGFRYQQIASLARAGARWASVRGPKYQKLTGKAMPTAADVVANAITPRACSLNPQRLTCTLARDAANTYVTVTLKYQWETSGYLKGIGLSSTSVMPITN